MNKFYSGTHTDSDKICTPFNLAKSVKYQISEDYVFAVDVDTNGAHTYIPNVLCVCVGHA